MGLLDPLLGGMGQDEQMMLAAGLLRGNGNLGANLSQGLLGAQQQRQGRTERELEQIKLQQMKQQMEQRKAQEQAVQGMLAGNPELAQLYQVNPEMALSRMFPQQRQPKYHNVGGALVEEPQEPGGQARPVYQAPEKQSLPQGMRMGVNGPEWIPEYLEGKQKISAAGKTQVTTNVMPPREVFKDSMSLKKDFDAQPEVKGFKEVQGAWDQIRTALSDPSAANDLAAATKFMKLLDPGSVVRESELAMAMQASGALDRFMNYGNRLMKGHKLTPTQRNEFRAAGEALYNASKQRFGETVQQYEGIAQQYQLDPQFLPKPKANKSLSRNSTALYKAREAIKRGADPAAVKQRLEEQGFDSNGL